MGQLSHYVCRDPAFLLECAAAEFLVARPATSADPFPTPLSWLVLRHRGLRDDLYALAWRRGLRGWFDPPLCTFDEVPAVFGHRRTSGLTRLERAVLLHRLVRDRSGSVFRRGGRASAWIDALDRLVGALASEDIAPATFRASLEAIPNRDAFEETRDAELADLYEEYQAALTDVGRRDGRDDLIDAARAIAREPEEFARRLGGRREIRILGLQDLRGGWRELLRSLSVSPALDRVMLYTMHPLALPDDLSVPATELDTAPPPVATALFIAPDPEREAEELARQVRERIDAGVPPSQIAILARDASPLDQVIRALARCGVPVQASRRRALAELPLVRAVRATVTDEGSGTHASSPASIIGWVGRLRSVLRHVWQSRDRSTGGPDVVRQERLGFQAFERLCDDWQRAEQLLANPDEQLEVEDFRERLDLILSTDVTRWSEAQDGVHVMEATAAVYRSFDFVFVVGLVNGAFPARQRSSRLFPVATVRFLAERGLPLVTPAAWLQHEVRLFDALMGAPRLGVVISTARADELGEPCGPSGFFEKVRHERRSHPETIHSSEVILLPPGSEAAIARGAYAAHAERVRAEGPWGGRVESAAMRAFLGERFGPERIWQPSELEEYARCPFAYFSGRLLDLERTDAALERLARIRRDALRRLYTKLGEIAAGPVYLLPEHLALAAPLVEGVVDEAFATECGTSESLKPIDATANVRARLVSELLALLQAEATEHGASFARRGNARKLLRTGVVAHDVVVSDVTLRGPSGATLRIGGSLDRLEVSVDDRVRLRKLATAVQYKNSEAATPGNGDTSAWKDRVVLELPLYAVALGALRPEFKLARAEYRVLQDGAAVHRTQPMQVDPIKQSLRRSSAEQERLNDAVDAAIEYAGRIQRGEFPPAPAPSCNCPPLCHARDYCRIPGGPRTPPRR